MQQKHTKTHERYLFVCCELVAIGMTHVDVDLSADANRVVEMYQANFGFHTKKEAINDLVEKMLPHVQKLIKTGITS